LILNLSYSYLIGDNHKLKIRYFESPHQNTIMKPKPLISTLDTLALLECLKSHGISADEILEETRVDSALLQTPDFEIPLENLIRLWRKATEVTGDLAISIHLRQKYGSHFIHFVNYIGINSRTVKDALQQYNRYGKLMGSAFSYQLREENGHYAFSFDINSPEHQNSWIPEYHLSLIIYLAQMLRTDLQLERVHFRHACQGSPQPYLDFFKVPVLFEQAENSIFIPEQTMNIEIPGYDPHLQTVLKKQADDILAKLPQENELLLQIEEHIIQNMGTGMLDVEMVAGKLNVHRSTLHRKLKKSGTSFKELLATIKKRFAEFYLEQGMSIDQIAFLLGYSNRSNFQVAFKSWFGKPPGAYIKETRLGKATSSGVG